MKEKMKNPVKWISLICVTWLTFLKILRRSLKMAENVEIKERQEEIIKLATDIQDEHKAFEDRYSERVGKLTEEVAEKSQELQDIKLDLDEEKKAREDLELTIAQIGEKTNNGELKSDPAYVQGFVDFLVQRKDIDPSILEAEFKNIVRETNPHIKEDALDIAVKTLVVGSNPDGGFLVPVDVQSRIIKRMFETSPMRGLATVISTGTEAVEYPLDDGEFEVEQVAEVDTRGVTDTSKLGIITIPINELQATPDVTQKMLDDAMFNVEGWIQEKISSKISREENRQFVNGSGNKEAKGFQSYADWTTAGQYERDALETRETATASEFDGDDFIDLQTDLLEPYQANARWVMHRKVWAEVLKLKDATNENYLLNPAMLFQGILGMQLLGNPVTLFGDMPSAVADNALVVAYGDFREGYVIADRVGIRVLRDPYSVHGKVQYYTTKRTGAAVVNYQAIKRLKIKAAA
jgi:HK97 family phage major capsid protein